MPFHADLTREIREAPAGAEVGAFFDVDQTLLAGFSAGAFFQGRLLSGRMSPRELGQGLFAALRFALGRTGFSGFLAMATAAYRGVAESVLEELGQEVFERRLAAAIYPESRALVEAHRARGHTVAIVSAATRYQVDPLARDLGIEHVLCTRLEVERGVFTGRTVHPTCYGEGKAHYVREFAQARGVDLGQSFSYSDSAYDLPLLEAVGRPRPLNPDPRLSALARERGWPVRRFSSRGRASLAQVARTALCYASLWPSVAAGLGVALASRSHRDGVSFALATWADLAAALARVELRVEGERHLWSQRPAVFLFNHQSAADPLLLAKLLRRDFTGIGPAFALPGMAFADRSGSATAIAALRRGRSIAMAPEETRSATPQLGPFRRGAFRIAMRAGVPLVPVVLRNASDVLPPGGLVLRPATVEVVVLRPIPTRGWTREELDARIERMRNRYREVLEGRPPRRRRRARP